MFFPEVRGCEVSDTGADTLRCNLEVRTHELSYLTEESKNVTSAVPQIKSNQANQVSLDPFRLM